MQEIRPDKIIVLLWLNILQQRSFQHTPKYLTLLPRRTNPPRHSEWARANIYTELVTSLQIHQHIYVSQPLSYMKNRIYLINAQQLNNNNDDLWDRGL